MAYNEAVRNTYQNEIQGIRAAGLFKDERYIHSRQWSEIEVEFPAGAKPKKCINICANNYLGLSSHPEVIKAAHDGLDSRGYGMSSVRFICGTQDIHRELENRLTEFLGTEDTLLFPSCMDANAGFFEACLTEQDVMIADRLVHASIVDGMRLCGAMQDTFKHSDMGHLEEKLQEHQDKRFRMIITDGVFSMDGDIAPLPAIVEAAEEYGAAVFVDDAHASGVLGKDGRGSVSHFGLEGRVAIQVGTLSKAVGVLGGYVAGSQNLRDILIQRARPFLFSTSHPPAVAAACLEAIRIMQEEPELIERLWANTRRFKAELTRLGFDTGRSETPITPVMLGDSETTIRFSNRLFEEGVFGTSVVFPTVALDRARIRTIVTAAHTDELLDQALAAFDRVGRELGVISG